MTNLEAPYRGLAPYSICTECANYQWNISWEFERINCALSCLCTVLHYWYVIPYVITVDTRDKMGISSMKITDEERSVLGCGAVYILCEPTFRRKVSPEYSGYHNPLAMNRREQVFRTWIFLHWWWRRYDLPKRRFTQKLYIFCLFNVNVTCTTYFDCTV
jgi:hypothetical protein